MKICGTRRLPYRSGATLVLVLLFCYCLSPMPAAESPIRALAADAAVSSATGHMTILRAGELRADGFTSAAVMRTIRRPQPGSYLPNVLVIKTKEQFRERKGTPLLDSPALQPALAELDVESLSAAFPAFSSGELQSADEYGIGRMIELRYAADIDAFDAALTLSANPEIEYAEPLYIRYTHHTPDDPLFSQQYALDRIGAEAAWDISRGDEDVIIAIIDSGTDIEHEDLAANIWTNPNEIPNNNIDDDNNGKVDDVNGWDFVGNVSLNQVAAGQYREDNDPKVEGSADWRFDDRSHGTVVAGAAASVTNNGTGMAAIGYNCTLLPIKTGSDQPAADGIYRGYEAILYAAEMGADIINCSWGGPSFSLAEQDVVNQATAMGALVISSSGNEGIMTDLELARYPSNYDNVLNVGATNRNDDAAGFSNYGVQTHVYAPGARILAPVPDNGYQGNYWSGTSFATPIVSGLAGLLKSIHPDWTPQQIKHQIRSTAENVIADNDEEHPFYYGRLNAADALRINEGLTAGDRIPGIGMTALGFSDGSGSIKNTDPVTLRVTLRNHLARASNLRVSLSSLDGYLQAQQETISVGSVNTLEDKDVDFVVNLSAFAPWSNGYADVLLTYVDGDYRDYERIKVPVSIESDNRGSFISHPGAVISELQNITWNAAHAPSASVLWTTGTFLSGNSRVGIVVRASDLGIQALNFNQGYVQLPTYAIHGRNASVAYAGANSQNGGSARIMRTVNGGQSWSTESVSDITGFINHVHFFDDNNGIFLGDPVNRRWGIGVTSNAGGNWQGVSQVPQAANDEAGLAGSAFFLGDNGWFGTTNGRVYRTSNRGQNWAVSTVLNGAQVLAVSFISPENGIAVYRLGTDEDDPSFIASSTDGGASWQSNRFNMADASLDPAFAFGPENSLQNIIIGDDSQMLGSDDNGDSWYPLPSRKAGTTFTGAGVLNGSRIRVWRVHPHGISYTDSDFKVIPKDKEIQVSRSTLLFGNVRIKENGTQAFRITNTGLEAVQFNAPAFGGEGIEPGEYSLETDLPANLEPGAELVVRVVFSPKQTGNRIGTLTISGDFEEPYVVTLRGFGQEALPNTVGDVEKHGVRLFANAPNPAQNATGIRFSLLTAAYAELEVLDAAGRVLSRPFRGMAESGMNTLSISTADLRAGVYFYRLHTAGMSLVRSFVVTR